MSTMSLLGRLGRDADIRYLPNDGGAVANLAVAYNYGRKDQGGNQPTQWVDCTMFGSRAEALAPYLVKGQQLFLLLEDVHIRTYEKNGGGTGFALAGRIVRLEFAGSKQESTGQQPAPQRQAPQQQRQPSNRQPAPQSAPPPDMDDWSDEIPFD